MSSQTPSITAKSAEMCYPSLAALQAENNELLKRQRQEGDASSFRALVIDFLRIGAATGALLDADDDRRAAQSILDYWAARLFRLGEEPPDSTLVDFEPQLAPELPDTLCPYLGLDAFRESDHEKFFGRRELVAQLVARLADHRLLAVVGPSGSGKSSLVRAGLIPALRAGALPGSQGWHFLPTIVPGSDPLANLDRVIRSENQEPRAVDSSSTRSSSIILVVDQFEELFTLCDDEHAREQFIIRLLELVGLPDAQHRVVLTMRSDFETFIARVPQLQTLFDAGRVQVTPLSAGELREAIEQPAAAVGLKFESGVVDLLLQDLLGEPAGLPLLQFTLLKLWERRDRNRVTRAIYERVGGGRLALARSADAFYADLIPEEQVTARRIMLRIVRPGDGLEVTSRRIRRAELYRGGEDPGRVERVLEKLVQARLVRLTEGDTPDDAQVEVAHEALVRNWPTLVEWLEQEKIALATRRQLEIRAAEWARLGKGGGGLLDEVELREAEHWLSSPAAQYLGFSPELPALVRESRTAIQRAEQDKIELATAKAAAALESRLNWRLRRYIAGLIFLLVLAVIATVFAVQQQRAAQQALVAASSQRLAFAAQSQSRDAPETALLLAYEAIQLDRNPVSEQALRDAVEQIPFQPILLSAHNAPLNQAIFSPDGQRVLTAADDGTARLWDLAGHELVTFSGHTAPVRSASFSPDGQRVLTAADDGTARLWDLDGRERVVFKGHSAPVRSASFSPDGQRILTASDDTTARLWGIDGRLLVTLTSYPFPMRNAIFSPDGRRILTAADDATARLWDLAGHPLTRFSGHTSGVASAIFSADGQDVLTASEDGTARLWSRDGQLLIIYRAYRRGVRSIAFSPDGQHVLTASEGGAAHLWDRRGQLLTTLSGHTGAVLSAWFSPDGRRMVTASRDGSARLWEVTNQPLVTLRGHTDRVRNVAFNPDGNRILTASTDGTARVWDRAGNELLVLKGHTLTVRSAVFSPDGQYILTASWDHTARLWDAGGHQVLLLNHPAEVWTAVFSPDGSRILTAANDRRARLWDRAGRLIVTFEGHTDSVTDVAFSADGQRIVTSSWDKTARIWNLTGQTLSTLVGHTDAVRSATFSSNGQQVLTGSDDGTARLWDLAGNTVAIFKGHAGGLSSAVFSPDDQRILTASPDGTVRLWDRTGQQLSVLQARLGGFLSARFSPDGRRIAAASDDYTVHQFAVDIDDVLAVAACRVGRGLTNEEIARFQVPTPLRFDFAKRQCPPSLGN